MQGFILNTLNIYSILLSLPILSSEILEPSLQQTILICFINYVAAFYEYFNKMISLKIYSYKKNFHSMRRRTDVNDNSCKMYDVILMLRKFSIQISCLVQPLKVQAHSSCCHFQIPNFVTKFNVPCSCILLLSYHVYELLSQSIPSPRIFYHEKYFMWNMKYYWILWRWSLIKVVYKFLLSYKNSNLFSS